MGESDVSAAAKVLKNFAAEFQKPKIKVGILDKSVLEPADIMALADLPSKEVLQAKLLGLLLAPASTLVRLINTPASQVAQVLKAYSDKGEPINKTAAKEEPKAEAARGSSQGGSRSGGTGRCAGRGSRPGRRGGDHVTIWSRLGGVDKGKEKTRCPVSSEALRS